MPSSDINYKVAISTGAKELAAGQLKKAEDQFRFAVKRCPECGAGYRGLAKVFVELEDRASALETLREGAQALARAGNRIEALELLRDAVRLAPDDLRLHRHYAAALANAGSEQGAIEEYERYVTLVLERDAGRARLEVEYARETLGDAAGVRALAERVLARLGPAVEPRPAPASTAPAAPAATPPGSSPATDGTTPAAPVAAPGEAEPMVMAAPAMPETPRERALYLDARAQDLLRRGDPHGPATAVEAARALLAEGMANGAADLLLQLVAAGIPDRDAQRLLVDVARSLGRGEIAREKIALLATALRLDGRADAATEVERLAAV